MILMVTNKQNIQNMAKSYVADFYIDVVNLTSYLGDYSNILLELDFKNNLDDMDDVGKENIMNAVSQVRKLVEKTYISYITIIENNPDKFKKNIEIDPAYELINKKFIISRENLKKYVKGLNKFIANELIEDIMRNSIQEAEN